MLLCFSGRIGSGKSSVSSAVASSLGWRRIGFGDFLRADLNSRGGDPNSRRQLQDLGQSRVNHDPVKFCTDVLSFGGFEPSEHIVIDGIRHSVIFEQLARLVAPVEVRLIFLKADEKSRLTRLKGSMDRESLLDAEQHPAEADLSGAICTQADVAVDATRPLHEVVSTCLSYAKKWCRPSV
ncbi:MAG: AAA family ATPase [Bacteroidetes bacterium]|nr:AAA family ATPase [Bacteroidota bacterium]MDE2673147.1 AAA family ATPase [Bacteroidota bacterium]